ncbi:MAG: hypothetical protein NTV44_05555 [Firmicutes bacterium]|nr:hypothetical protein [Bacillota bacterium]
MRKEDLLSLFVYGIMIVIAIYIGLMVIKPAFTNIEVSNEYVFAIASILAGFLINVVLAEIGHVIGALLGGYSIISVNLLGLCLYKNQGEWEMGIRPYEGLTGETKIIPHRKNAKPLLNLWSGLILYVIEFAIGITMYVLLPQDSWLRYSAVIVISVGGMLMFYNVMPFKLDTMTDGYRLALITKGVNVEAYNELMRIDMETHEGKIPTDIKTFSEITSLTAQVNLYRVYELLGQRLYAPAEEILDNILAQPGKLNDTTNGRVMSQKLYVMILTKSHEEAEKFYKEKLDSKQKHFLASDLSMESLRAYLLVSGTIEESLSECVYVLERKERALKRSVEPGRKDIEIGLFNDALRLVKEKHPDWEWPK